MWGQEYTFASTSVMRVWRDSSFKHVLWFFSSDAQILLADLIWCYHTLPIWLAAWAFLNQINQSATMFARKCWICWSFILLKAFLNSLLAPTKFKPLSDDILLILPCLAINHLSARIHECLHWVCGFNMHCSTCKACKDWSISLQFLPAPFYDKWTKHIYFTVCERG